MKRATAIHHVHEISRRIKAINGLLATPTAGHEAVRISRAWVFGSTVKGKINPSDVDILLEIRTVGRLQTANHARKRKIKVNSPYYKHRGLNAKSQKHGFWRGFAIFSRNEAFKYLRQGMQKISLHDYNVSNDFGDINQTKVMIYPRFDFGQE